MLDLYKLDIFAMVVREGSFSGAAARLLMTQSGVSQHIQDLENHFGTALFHRGRRGVTLTPAGEKLHAYTRTLFSLVAEIENAVTDVEHLAGGQIRTGATPGISVYLMPEWVQSFRGRYPNLVVSLQTGITPQIIEDLCAYRLDIGLIEGELDDINAESLGVETLREDPQYLIVGRKHLWWERDSVNIDELNGQAFIMRQRHSQTRKWLEQTLHRYHVTTRITAEFDNLESIKRAVMAGNCLAVLPAYTVQQERELDILRVLPVENADFRRTLKLVWAAEKPFSPLTKAFIAHLRRYFRDGESKKTHE